MIVINGENGNPVGQQEVGREESSRIWRLLTSIFRFLILAEGGTMGLIDRIDQSVESGNNETIADAASTNQS